MATTPAPGEILCPDPSLHDHSKLISEPASKAALLAAGATTTVEQKSDSGNNLLTQDGRLSSRGAASSLKYAKAQDLPSFPSRGATSNASLAAAVLAKDYEMEKLWHPQASAAGLKAAATAQKDGGKLDLWQPTASAAGNSAAVIAMRVKGLSPELDRGYTATGRASSMVAAKQSHTVGRQRAGSVPTVIPPQYPDSHNSTKNALNAAVVSHRTSRMAPDGWDSEANQAARIGNLGGNMDREMFGANPPVEPELEEQRHQAALRASAVSMARQMYERAATPTDTTSLSGGAAGAEVAHKRNQSSTSQADLKQEAMKYLTLQDAAHKIAQERLAKLDREMADSRYREYYGYGETSPKKSRMSMRRRGRAASEGEGDPDDSDDERQARRIRNQMSQLSTGVNTVDLKQRQQDRAKLMAAAEKRVHARMHDMDEKVFAETGKVSQSMMDEWEAKAREKAEIDRAERDKTKGKVAIGGGKFMDQSEIEAIAAARLKPTLEEIDDTAAQMRARDEEMRRKQDELETAQMTEKMKQSQQKAEFKRIKEQDKAAARKEKEERKAAERAEKDAEKARKAEEKRKSREAKREEVSVVAGGDALGEVATKVKDEKELEEQRTREAALDGSAALAEVAAKVKNDREMEESGDFAEGDGAVVAVGAAGVAGVAGVAAYATLDRQDTGPAPNTIGPHESDLANIVDPRVKPDPELQKATVTNPETGPASDTIGPHESNLANILDPRVKPDPELQKDTVTDPETGPAPNTVGPHSSDLANIVDPRVVPAVVDTQREGDVTAEGPHQSVIANILDPKVDSDAQEDQITEAAPVVVAGAAVTGAAVATQTDTGVASEVGGDPKRKSSLFGRIKDRFKSRDEKRAGQSSTATRVSTQTTDRGEVVGVPVVDATPSAVEEKDDDIDRSMAAEALMGVGAAGAGIAAAVAVASPSKDEGATKDDVSSLSTQEERGQGELEQYTTTSEEHNGDHNFAMASVTDAPQGLAPPQRMVLERHISTIEDSSDEELVDSDAEEDTAERGRVRGAVVEGESPVDVEAVREGQGLYKKEFGAYERTTQGGIVAEGTLTEGEIESTPVVPAIAVGGAAVESETNEFGAYERAGKGGTATEGELENKFMTYELNDPNPETTEAMKQQIRQVEQEKAEVYGIPPEQPKEKGSLLQKVLSPFKSKDDEGESAGVEEQPRSPVSPLEETATSSASPHEPTPVSPTPEDPVASAPVVPAAAVVQSAPSEDEPSSSSQQPQKERKGIKGIFSKLTSKPDHKLTKRTPDGSSSVAESEKSAGDFVGGAKLTGGDDKDGVIRPVTETSTGAAEELGLTDGTVGDTHPEVGITGAGGGAGAAARAESPSSFKRHENEDLGDLDDVSSSGAEEEDVQRGRAGRLARKLGLRRDKGQASDGAKVQTSGTTEGEGEQFEEARDQFDESLAPPPAFAGQSKNESQSPARETKFQEEF